jgi:hypothetical protein
MARGDSSSSMAVTHVTNITISGASSSAECPLMLTTNIQRHSVYHGRHNAAPSIVCNGPQERL